MKRFCSKILGSEMGIGFISISPFGLALNSPVPIHAKIFFGHIPYASEAVPIDHQQSG